jgi:hypothetical protein
MSFLSRKAKTADQEQKEREAEIDRLTKLTGTISRRVTPSVIKNMRLKRIVDRIKKLQLAGADLNFDDETEEEALEGRLSTESYSARGKVLPSLGGFMRRKRTRKQKKTKSRKKNLKKNMNCWL